MPNIKFLSDVEAFDFIKIENRIYVHTTHDFAHFEKIDKWCAHHLSNDYMMIGTGTWVFACKCDAAKFRLQWT